MIVFFQLAFLKLVVFLTKEKEELIELIWQHRNEDFQEIAPNTFVFGNMAYLFLSKEGGFDIPQMAAILTGYFDLPESAFNEIQTMLNCATENF